jgi:hypothetical protein
MDELKENACSRTQLGQRMDELKRRMPVPAGS